MVVDHPYIAVTDAKGNFEIKNVPAGTQKVVVWQEAVGFVTAPSGEDVTIKPNDTTDSRVSRSILPRSSQRADQGHPMRMPQTAAA